MGQVSHGVQRGTLAEQRMSRMLTSYRRQVTLVGTDQVVQRFKDRSVRTWRRRMEHLFINAVAGLDKQQSRPGLMTEKFGEHLVQFGSDPSGGSRFAALPLPIAARR